MTFHQPNVPVVAPGGSHNEMAKPFLICEPNQKSYNKYLHPSNHVMSRAWVVPRMLSLVFSSDEVPFEDWQSILLTPY